MPEPCVHHAMRKQGFRGLKDGANVGKPVLEGVVCEEVKIANAAPSPPFVPLANERKPVGRISYHRVHSRDRRKHLAAVSVINHDPLAIVVVGFHPVFLAFCCVSRGQLLPLSLAAGGFLDDLRLVN